jgi:hypothetical protein
MAAARGVTPVDVAALVVDPSFEEQCRAAGKLAQVVDATVRARLADERRPPPRRGGRPAAVDAWARSLVSADPWLPASLDPAKVRALAKAVPAWVRIGAVVEDRVRLCVRVREPKRGRPADRGAASPARPCPSLAPLVERVGHGQAPMRLRRYR